MKKQLQLLTILISLGLFILTSGHMQSQDQWWKDWTKNFFNPVIQTGPDTWFYYTKNTGVIYDVDSYKIWFSGWSTSDATRRVGYATSLNGIIWDIHDEPVLSGTVLGTSVYVGTVLKINDTLKMWYSGLDLGIHFLSKIGYAWSMDGINWNEHYEAVLNPGPAGSWDQIAVFNPSVIFDGNTYHMYYSNFFNMYAPAGIGYATSSNGLNWTKDTVHNPIHWTMPNTFYDGSTYASGALLHNDTVHMWFTGREINPVLDRIGYGYSTDFHSFTWYEDTALHCGPLSWDLGTVQHPCVLNIDGRYRMWYTGCNVGANLWSIGQAEGQLASCIPVYYSGCEDGHGFTDFIMDNVQNQNSGCGNINGTGWSEYYILGYDSVEIGLTQTIKMRSGQNMQYVSIWADWNQNMEYEDNEMIIDNFIMEQAGMLYEVEFPVPGTLTAQEFYTLRARTNFGDSCTDPCKNYYYGETEEYQLYAVLPVNLEDITNLGIKPQVDIYPNPANGSINFEFSIANDQHILLMIYDLHGRVIATVFDGMMSKGEHEIRFDAGSLPPGIYVYRQMTVDGWQLAVGKLMNL